MKKPLKIFLIFVCLALAAGPLAAETVVKARAQSTADRKAWVDLEAFIGASRMRLDFRGPWTHGSLIYDRDDSRLTLVDDLHKTVLPVSAADQTALRLLLAVTAGQLKGRAEGSPEALRAYRLAEENARAFFNGVPELAARGVSKDGFTCDRYVTRIQGEKAREAWVTPPQKAGMPGVDYDTFRSLAHLVLDLGGSLLNQWGADREAFQGNFSHAQLPVAEVLYARGRPTARFRVLEVKSGPFTDRLFDPPADYRSLGLLDLLHQGGSGTP